MKCNGCGGDIEDWGGAFGYGGPAVVPDIHDRAVIGDNKMYVAEYWRTLCHKCAAVLKDILLNSDLSDHWDDE